MKESTVKNLQATMKYHGFYEGEPDGVWGNQSHAAFYAMAEAAAHCPHREEATNVNLEKPNTPVAEPDGKFYLSSRSASKLSGAHPHLRKVVERAIKLTPIDFTVGETLRSIERQQFLLNTGKSSTMNSRHLPGSKGYSFAVDLYVIRDGKVSNDMADYCKIADAMKQAAKELGTPLEWGGDWKTFKDGPHFQLPWASYGRDD